jgi:hypothetical protein
VFHAFPEVAFTNWKSIESLGGKVKIISWALRKRLAQLF